MSDAIRQRFHSEPVPSLVARADLPHPIVFSHVVGRTAMPAPTLAPPEDRAYALHVHHRPLSRGDMWVGGRHRRLPRVADAGLIIFDLTSGPVAQIHESFEFSRFHLSQASLDDLAYEHGMPRITGLHAEGFAPDPVIKHLALALLHRTAVHGQGRDSLYVDAVMLALFTHVARTYGAMREALPVGLLPPWQVRRVAEWVESHLHESVSTADLAALVQLSPSHFSRSFGKSVGMSPHRWLLLRRIGRCKRLLKETALPLSEIADCCGFADQSHLTNVFQRLEGSTPARWRRNAK